MSAEQFFIDTISNAPSFDFLEVANVADRGVSGQMYTEPYVTHFVSSPKPIIRAAQYVVNESGVPLMRAIETDVFYLSRLVEDANSMLVHVDILQHTVSQSSLSESTKAALSELMFELEQHEAHLRSLVSDIEQGALTDGLKTQTLVYNTEAKIVRTALKIQNLLGNVV